jgi:AcrR family transcriptional regulator
VDRLPEHLASGSIGRRPIAPEARAAFRRRRILDAATGEFAAKGYWAITVDEIVAAAQIGVGSFYEHFENKEDCFLAAFELARERVSIQRSRQSPWALVLAAIDSGLWLAENDPAAFQLLSITAPNASPRAQSRHEQFLEHLALELGRVRGADSPLPQSLEAGLIAGAAWAIADRLACGKGETIAELRDEFALALLAPYLGETKARALVDVGLDG